MTEAVAAGVRRLVLLSAGGTDHDNHPLKPAEQAVRGSGVEWTILRPTWFAQNFSEDSWRSGILSGNLTLPTGEGRTPFIDAEDIAEVAASALTEDRHNGQVYVLTGPRAISFGEAAGIIAKATGRTTVRPPPPRAGEPSPPHPGDTSLDARILTLGQSNPGSYYWVCPIFSVTSGWMWLIIGGSGGG